MDLFSCLARVDKRAAADAVVLPFWEKKGVQAATSITPFTPLLKPAFEAKDFKGKEGELLWLYPQEGKEKRCVLLGLGKEEKLDVDSLRRAYAALVKSCRQKKIESLNLLLPNIVELRRIGVDECLKGVCEGILLANYLWRLKEDDEERLLQKVVLIGVHEEKRSVIQEAQEIAEGVYLVRDLVNGNADVVTPDYLAQSAHAISKKFPVIKTTVWDKARLEKEKLGLILAVGRGSVNEPRLIMMKYEGHPRSKDHTVLIGKGVTFDTGGLNLKPTGGIETMRDDMAGGAAVMGAVAVAAALKLKVNVTAVVPSVENAIDAKSFKPGDVYKSYLGKTVEVNNTDAEGRLILADAIAFSIKNLRPTRLIDLATLTGSVVVALGNGFAGLFANDDALVKSLQEASEKSHELLWRLPLYSPYKELLSSDIADIKNSGGRAGGPILAALFLEAFTTTIPWAHLDIAGPAFASKEEHYRPKNGVGFGVRLLVEFLKNLSR